MTDRFHLTFPHDRVTDPVLCEIAKHFEITFSIRRANVTHDAGWMDLQIEGTDEEIERVIVYLQERDVRVDPIEGDIVAG